MKITQADIKEVIIQIDAEGKVWMILHIIEAELLEDDEWGEYWFCVGYVENVLDPECSEYGTFGLNKEKTCRIW